jgi:hypothetical protein
MAAANSATAAPVQFNQVVQVVNAKPGKAGTAVSRNCVWRMTTSF